MVSRTYTWNWSTVTGSKNDSQRVRQSSPSLTSRALPSRGAWDAKQLSSIHSETLSDVMKLFNQWNNMVQPILKSLSAGGSDKRWSGLRKEIDALTYGIDATTLFVTSDASPNIFGGRYWNSLERRPSTIAELIEDHEGRIAAVEQASSTTSTSSSSSLFDDSDLWAAIGYGKKPGYAGTSTSGSLHGTQLTLTSNLTKLAKDMYGVNTSDPSWPNYQTTWSGPVFKYGLYEYVSYLASIHDVNMSSWDNPSGASHDALSLGAHTHTQDEIEGSGYSTLGRTFGLPANLEEDIQRLRYEIEYTRGTSWNSGNITGPFVTNYPSSGNSGQTLNSHINYKGSSTPTTGNPHGISYIETGAGVLFGYLRTYTGQTTEGDFDPYYSSTTYITQGTSLTEAIGDLDSSLSLLVSSSSVIRQSYISDRSIYSEEYRATHPIQINHSFGGQPLVQVLDLTPSTEDAYGQYQSLDQYSNVVHVDVNNIEVWTNAATVQVIMIG